MQRDKKVGLALAILLCSIVGAFFIRDESPRGNTPELKDPKQLDATIAQGDKSPYPEPDSRRTNNGQRNDRNARPWELPDFMRKDGDRAAGSSGKAITSKDPFDRGNWNNGNSDITSLTPPTDDETSAVPIPRGNEVWEIPGKNDGTTARNNGGDSSAGPNKLRSHVVVAGETLSSIAGKYLGTQARYLDIFQANRDQLKSPDDLKVGMKLNIPGRNNEPKPNSRSTITDRMTPNNSSRPNRQPPVSSTSKVTEKSKPTESSTDLPPKKVQFKPSKTSPAIRRSAEADAAPSGKSLTQTPPQDLLEVDDGILAELERNTEPQAVAKSEKPQETPTVPRVAQVDPESTNSAESKSEAPMPMLEEPAK